MITRWQSHIKLPVKTAIISILIINPCYFPARIHYDDNMPLPQIFHKICVKCKACNTTLPAGSVLEHDDEIYCKSKSAHETLYTIIAIEYQYSQTKNLTPHNFH